jgi:ATP-GRASP peptide maturase of grasp-with-spasm system
MELDAGLPPAPPPPMILVLSPSYSDLTTDDVLDWLQRCGAHWLRLNGEEIDGGAGIEIELRGERVGCRLSRGGAELRPSEVTAVWHRGWLREWRHEGRRLVADPSPAGERLQYDVKLHLTREGRKASEFLLSCFDAGRWLGSPGTVSPNKPAVLALAARAGLAIPDSLITTERAALAQFSARHQAIVSKPIAETILLAGGGATHLLYTSVVPPELIAELPERFPPTLFQERLAKEYELRIFYLDGECHAMAIFSQQDPQTAVDFRRYNHARPNRRVPYRLRPDTERGIRALMGALELETGSLDMVRTPDGRDVFLEVNPVGQFGMVSQPCNYRLERRVAERLIQRANDGGRPRTACDGG